MKKIVFDLTKTQPLQSNNIKFHGGGKYGIEVFRRLVEIASDKIIAYYNNSCYISEEVSRLINLYQIPVYYYHEISIVDLAEKEKSIIYSPIDDKRYINDKSVIVITTIHDIRGLVLASDKYMFSYHADLRLFDKIKRKLESCLFPLFVRYKYHKVFLKYESLINSQNIRFVTVSNYSKYAILCSFPHKISEDINVFYAPSSICRDEITETPKKLGKYWMIVSGNRWVKNSIRAVQAFDSLFSQRPELEGKVVITGLKSLKDLKIRVKNSSRFLCVGYVNERELKSLYHYAFALVYPTLSEGFGFPPLEAMYEGCPVIGSAVSSIPEICGDAILYFNPYSVHEIKTRILQFEDEIVRNSFSERGKVRQKIIESRQNEDLDKLCKYILSNIDSATD